MSSSKHQFKIQSLKFAVVGILTAVIYYCSLYGLVEFINASIMTSSAIAYIVAITFNYLMHYQWTFRSKSPHQVAVLRFIIMNIGGFFINVSIMSYGAVKVPEYYLWVQLFAIGVIVVWNFIFSSLWVYKHKQEILLVKEN